jgi:hypothetical protein
MDGNGFLVEEEGAIFRRGSDFLIWNGGRRAPAVEEQNFAGEGFAACSGVFGTGFMPLFSAPVARPLRAVFARKFSPVSSRRMSRAAATRCSR